MKLMLYFLFFLKLIYSKWTTSNYSIYYENTLYKIRGINWFGINNDCLCTNGLWVHDLDFYLDLIKDKGFNSIRIPLSMESIYAFNQTVKKECVYPEIEQTTVSQFLHLLFQKTRDRNMSILVDFHSIYNVITEYPWYDDVLTQQEFIRLWTIVIQEFQQYSNLIGIDIKNEPHGSISLNTWITFIDSFVQNISIQYPDFQGLFFIEGVQQENSVWGGSINYFPNFTNPRIILSPHIYGVSVRGTSALYDNSMQWDIWFGNRKKDPSLSSPICIGEIGGMFIDEDWEWQQRMLYYLLELGITDFYFWGLTPNSYDVGGILDTDWTQLIPRKIWFCEQLQQHPTFIDFP